MSNGFKFKMQKVLDFREKSEQDAMLKLASAQTSWQTSLTELTELKTELAEMASKKEEQVHVDVDNQIMFTRYAEHLGRCISSMEQTVAEKETIVTHSRCFLEGKMIEKKIINRLKEKQFVVHNQEEFRAEQKQNDEMAISGYVRRGQF